MPHMPANITTEPLRAALDLPWAGRLEVFTIEPAEASRAVPVACAQGANIDALWSTVHSVGACIPCAARQLLGSHGFDKTRLARIRLGVEDVDPRGTETCHHQITSLQG